VEQVGQGEQGRRRTSRRCGEGSRAAVTKGAAWAGARPGGAQLGGVEQVGRGQAGGTGRGWSWAGAARCEEEEARVSG
jgi:hypothetical protein